MSNTGVLFQIDTDEDELNKSKQLDGLGLTLRIQTSKMPPQKRVFMC